MTGRDRQGGYGHTGRGRALCLTLCLWLMVWDLTSCNPTRQIFLSLFHRRMKLSEAEGLTQSHTGRKPQGWGSDLGPSNSRVHAFPVVRSHNVTQGFFWFSRSTKQLSSPCPRTPNSSLPPLGSSASKGLLLTWAKNDSVYPKAPPSIPPLTYFCPSVTPHPHS